MIRNPKPNRSSRITITKKSLSIRPQAQQVGSTRFGVALQDQLGSGTFVGLVANIRLLVRLWGSSIMIDHIRAYIFKILCCHVSGPPLLLCSSFFFFFFFKRERPHCIVYSLEYQTIWSIRYATLKIVTSVINHFQGQHTAICITNTFCIVIQYL